jgi:murein DD-endopeptidase MepM/ murein hydrolase activator NlpD
MPIRDRMKEESVAGSSLSTLRISIADMVSLNVRTRGSRNLELPETLFQEMPVRAMSLMASIPCGAFAVSIPGKIGFNRGYAIRKDPPSSADGFVVVYDRKPNARYEAVSVQYQSRELGIAEFVEIARRWVARHMGSLKEIACRYAYLAPTRDEWGVILRDGGYTAWDPSTMPSGITPELRTSLQTQQSSALISRIPLFAGDKQSPEALLPVFAQVAVTLDPDPGPQSAWVSYAEYKGIRDLLSQPPDPIIREFHEWLSRLTKESGFEYWIFHPGMVFGDCIEWWGERCRRRTEHEGCDFAKGWKPGAGICHIPEGVPVSAIAEGDAVAILDDFLGKTVVVRHPAITRSNGDVFHTLLSHIQPLIKEPGAVAKGQILGRMSRSTNARVPAHLHLTGAWIPETLVPDEIRMDHIHPAFAPIALTNFKNLMQDNPLCRFDTFEGA